MAFRIILLLSFVLVLNQEAYTQVEQILNVYGRQTTSLNGKWHYIIDPYETGYLDYRLKPYDIRKESIAGNPPSGSFQSNAKPKQRWDRIEYNFDKSPTMVIPSDWNSQEPELLYYEGTVWFKKSFDYTLKKGKRLFVYFGGANYEKHVYLNQKKLGEHIGGFTPFNFEITDKITQNDNFLIVKVDNKRKREAVPTVNTDWWNYGGITRDVILVEVPETFVQSYVLQINKKNKKELRGSIQLNGSRMQQKVTVNIPEIGFSYKTTTDEKGYVEFTTTAPKLTKWSPEQPKLYRVEIKTDTDQIVEQIGFRTIEVKGKDILLNDEPVFLRGICIHEEVPQRKGRASSETDAKMLLGWAKELGCNFVRLAHYPHNEYMVRTAEKMGIMVWEENPVYWTIEWDNKDTYANAQNQLIELIQRDKNRANVIIWSISNETPVGEARNTFLKKLVDTAKKLDDTRLISAALEINWRAFDGKIATVDDPFEKYVDVLSFNQYIGWYFGLPQNCPKVQWKIPEGKPVIISEFGAGALKGLYADSLTRWTEEYQESLYKNTLKMLNNIEALRGITPWVLVDFRSPKRLLPNIQDGWNRKGLYSERGEKKKAFFVMKKFYEEKKKEYDK